MPVYLSDGFYRLAMGEIVDNSGLTGQTLSKALVCGRNAGKTAFLSQTKVRYLSRRCSMGRRPPECPFLFLTA